MTSLRHRNRLRSFFIFFAVLIILACQAAVAQDVASQDKALQIFRSLDDKVSMLKQQALDVNRDLILIEEESFIPASAQLVVFLSLTKKTLPDYPTFQVKLNLDGNTVSNHFYQADELRALYNGGMHRLYLGSLPVGKHTLVAHLEARSANGDSELFQSRASIEFSKGWDRKFLEIAVELPEKPTAPKVAFKE
jgi:hypothetical protein